MDYPNNGPGTPGGTPIEETETIERVREYAEDAAQNFNEAMRRGRELVTKNPMLTVAGAVAAGWLFARLVARRR